jgi:hypothetical protein
MHLDQSALLVGLIRESMRAMLGKVGVPLLVWGAPNEAIAS